MTTNPLISVIIPCFNAGRFIAFALDSVLAQTYSDREIIVVNDGSTDNSSRILEAYQHRVHVETTPNRGVSAARNVGTSMARGAYFQYLDADDLLRPDALEQRIHAAQSSGAEVVYGPYQILEEDSTGAVRAGAVVERVINEIHSDPAIAILTGFWVPPSAVLYSRSIVEKIGLWNERLPIIQDARFLLDAALQGARFHYLPQVLTDYRVCPTKQHLSTRNRGEFMADIYRNACEVEHWWISRGGLTPVQKAALTGAYDYAARYFWGIDGDHYDQCMLSLFRVQPGLRWTRPKVASLLARIIGRSLARRIIR